MQGAPIKLPYSERDAPLGQRVRSSPARQRLAKSQHFCLDTHQSSGSKHLHQLASLVVMGAQLEVLLNRSILYWCDVHGASGDFKLGLMKPRDARPWDNCMADCCSFSSFDQSLSQDFASQLFVSFAWQSRSVWLDHEFAVKDFRKSSNGVRRNANWVTCKFLSLATTELSYRKNSFSETFHILQIGFLVITVVRDVPAFRQNEGSDVSPSWSPRWQFLTMDD